MDRDNANANANSKKAEPQTNKRRHEEILADSDYYKEKLIKLARAHAALLLEIGSEKKQSTENVDHGEEELLCHSQLSQLTENDGDIPPGSQENLAKSDDESTLIIDPSNSLLLSQKSIVSTSVGNHRPLSPDLDRWNSVASQRSAFSEFIMQNMNIFVNTPELNSWCPSLSSNDKNQSSNTPEHEVRGVQQSQNSQENIISVSSESSKSTHVRVGVGVLVKDPRKPNSVFAGIRKGSHGAGKLALPGGHLEMQESWEDCAKREVLEETGLEVCELKLIHVTNDPMPDENKHYITIFMSALCIDQNSIPQNLEPHKCLGWKSYSWDELKSISLHENPDLSLFSPFQHLIEDDPESVLQFLGQRNT